ncbi:hypothetical protein ABPG77_004264 [Micractinium sp. CCAP 211/92]
MARKKIREYDSKRLLKAHIARLAGLQLPIAVAQVKEATNFAELVSANPWMTQTPLVVKPDCLFGKRGKHDLVGLKLDYLQAQEFVAARMNKVVDMDGTVGKINCFIIEPFVPHEDEYYLCIQSERLGYTISFSEFGGMEIEENWDKVRTVTIPTGAEASSERLAPLLSTLPPELRGGMERFIAAAYAVYLDLDFTLMEMNPFTLDAAGQPFPLDMRGELDDTAAFRRWGRPPAYAPGWKALPAGRGGPRGAPNCSCSRRVGGVWLGAAGVCCCDLGTGLGCLPVQGVGSSGRAGAV